MEVKVTNKDVWAGYLAQIFNYGTGVIVLPVILHKLSAAEIGMNYVMLSVGALANMADFGFSGQIGRNVTYVLSGAQKIFRGEIEKIERGGEVNYYLLKTIIDASRFLYRRLSLAVLVLLLSFGTIYMHHVTEGFSNVENALPIWILYSVSVYFNLYFLYYNSLLTGAGKIMEQRLATIYSRIAYIVLCFVLIFSGFGLMSVVVANLVSPFIARYYSYYKFFTKEMQTQLPKERVNKVEVKSALSDIWVTAKKSGTNTIGHYIGTQGSTFIAGAYLPLAVTAQWGLLTQLFGVVHGIASNMGISFYPEYCKLRLRGEHEKFIQKSSLSIALMLAITFIGGLFIIYLAPCLLNVIETETELPVKDFMWAYLFYMLILSNAQLFAMMMSSRNVIPSPIAVLTTAAGQLILTILLLMFTNIGIWALLLGPLISGCSYTLWRWTQLELKDMNLTAIKFYETGFLELYLYLKNFYKRIIG